MARPKEKRDIERFSDRIDWIVKNLDTDPTLLRFCNFPEDIYNALVSNIKRDEFVGESKYSTDGFHAPGPATWDRAVKKDDVAQIFIDWLVALFPDLSQEWLVVDTYKEFEELGLDISTSRERWKNAIVFYSKERDSLKAIALNFYARTNETPKLKSTDMIVPLLAKRGWFRNTPLELNHNTEDEYLHEPSKFKRYSPTKLEGLVGEYVSYKGSLTYKKRRKSKIEPQHNGEIFCATEVVFSDGQFVGFKYRLGRYYDYINTCEVLGAELADQIVRRKIDDLDNVVLTRRGSSEDAYKLDFRASYPGVNCLTIFRDYNEEEKLPKGNYFLLHKRDETQLQAQNSVHVLPAGGHQGYSKGAAREDTAIWRTVVREFFEELFDKESLYNQSESLEDVLLNPDIETLTRIFFHGEDPGARIYLHGFGLDPITLKPEVIVTIVVDWKIVQKKFPKLQLKYNWEVARKDSSRHQWVKLSKENLIRQAGGYAQSLGDVDLSTLPAGAACMLFAAEHLDQIMGNGSL